MKRKLALLLAAVMVLAALPMNVFASSSNTITKSVNAEKNTAYFENGWLNNTTGDVKGTDTIDYWVDGTDLKVTLNDTTPKGRSFTLTLENASWFFRRTGGETVTVTTNTRYDLITVNNEDVTGLDANRNTTGLDLALEVDGGDAGGATNDFVMDEATARVYLTNKSSMLDISKISTAATTAELGTPTNTQASTAAALAGAQAALITTEYGLTSGSKTIAASSSGGILNKSVWDTRTDVQEETWLGNKDNFIVVGADITSATVTADYLSFVEKVITAISNYGYYTENGTNYYMVSDGTDYVLSVGTLDAWGNVIPGASYASYYYYVPLHYAKFTEGGTGATSGTNTGDGYTDSRFKDGVQYIGTGRSGYDPIVGGNGASTYDPSKGTVNYSSSRAAYVYTRNNQDGTNGYGKAATKAVKDHEIGYDLEVITSGNQRVATVTINEDAPKDSYLLIPLVMRTTAEGDYRVKIASNITEVSSGNLLIGSKISGKTNATAGADYTYRNSFKDIKLTVNELKVGTFKSSKWTFEIRAPRNYYFDNNLDNVYVTLEGGVKWTDTGATGRKTVNTSNCGVHLNFKYEDDSKKDTDYSIVEVTVDAGTITPSTNLTGSMYFYPLTLIIDDEEAINADTDVYIALKDTNGSANTVITNQDVKVGTARDYDIILKRLKDKIPELVSGRLEGHVSYDDKTYSDDIDDEHHQAASVYFEERVADAWWAQRNTVFTLPEEVRFMKVELDEIDGLTSTAETNLMKGSNNGNDGIYYNSRKRINNVTINNNKMTLTNLAIKDGEKAYFEMNIWLSIRVDFDKDIDLVLDNSAFKYTSSSEDISVTIAKAIRPVEIETKVTEVKVGYQYVSVADFDIVENKAGNLLRDETVYVSVTDENSLDMSIAKGFGVSVTEGNLKIKDVETTSLLGNYSATLGQGAQLSFVIDRESTVASTISFTNVQVKIDRSVAYSNVSNSGDRGINLYAWGPAVAKNYYYLYSSSDWNSYNSDYYNMNTNDLFNVAGVSEKYINVVTLPSDSTQSTLTNQVAVTMGSTSYTINGQTYELEVAPYVSTASNSAMVPLRFIANALGLDTNAVKWDPATSTVTIDAGNRILQFQTGSSYYSVNGTMTPMTSPDGLAVEMEISGERAFVPFRALGEAFNVAVKWDPATSTATYNAPAVQ